MSKDVKHVTVEVKGAIMLHLSSGVSILSTKYIHSETGYFLTGKLLKWDGRLDLKHVTKLAKEYAEVYRFVPLTSVVYVDFLEAEETTAHPTKQKKEGNNYPPLG